MQLSKACEDGEHWRGKCPDGHIHSQCSCEGVAVEDKMPVAIKCTLSVETVEVKADTREAVEALTKAAQKTQSVMTKFAEALKGGGKSDDELVTDLDEEWKRIRDYLPTVGVVAVQEWGDTAVRLLSKRPRKPQEPPKPKPKDALDEAFLPWDTIGSNVMGKRIHALTSAVNGLAYAAKQRDMEAVNEEVERTLAALSSVSFLSGSLTGIAANKADSLGEIGMAFAKFWNDEPAMSEEFWQELHDRVPRFMDAVEEHLLEGG